MSGTQIDSFNVEEVPTPYTQRPRVSEYVGAPVEVEKSHRPAVQTNTEAIFNMLNAALGVSLLAIAGVCLKIGLVPAMLLYGVSCFLNRYTLHLVYRSCQIAKVKVSYPDVARACFGTSGFGVCAIIMTSQMCITSTAYVVTVAEVLQNAFGWERPEGATLLGMLLLIPFTLIRSLKRIAVLSTVATVACLIEMVAIAGPCYWDYFTGNTLVERKGVNLGEPENMVYFDLTFPKLIQVTPIILLAYATQSSAPIILASLENDSWENVRKITGFVYVVLYAISVVFGHSVYMRFTNFCTDNALTTIGQRPIDQVAIWCGFLLVFISYIFMQFPIRNVLMSACLGKDEIEREAPYSTFVAVTMSLNCTLLLCAMAAIKLGGLILVLRFGGGFCATLMAMVFPPLLFVRVRATRGWNTRVVCGSRGGLAIILAIGTSCWMLSNYSLTTDVLTQMGILSPPADDTTNTTAEILEAFGSVVSIL